MNKKTTKNRPIKDKIKTLDLHGFTEDEVFTSMDKFITKHSNEKLLRIIPGKGKGIVRNKALEYLKKAHYPYRMENEGSLLIFLS